jgi:hypothetical protein
VGVFLERAARIHMMGAQSGAQQASFPSAATRKRRHEQVWTPVHVEHSWNYFTRKLAWLERVNGSATLFN